MGFPASNTNKLPDFDDLNAEKELFWSIWCRRNDNCDRNDQDKNPAQCIEDDLGTHSRRTDCVCLCLTGLECGKLVPIWRDEIWKNSTGPYFAQGPASESLRALENDNELVV
jgi:hypothetical protein